MDFKGFVDWIAKFPEGLSYSRGLCGTIMGCAHISAYRYLLSSWGAAADMLYELTNYFEHYKSRTEVVPK